MSIILTTHYGLIKRSYLDALWHTSVNSNMDTIDITLNDIQDDVTTRISSSQKGVVNGVASLDGSGWVPQAQIPALVISKITNLQTSLDGKVLNITTTLGDLLYCSSTGTPGTVTRLGIGSTTQILTVSGGGIPTWSTATWQPNVITTKGDLIIGDAGGAPSRLTAGANGYILTANSGTASWQPMTSNLNTAVTPYNLAVSANIGTSVYAALADHVHSYTGLLVNVMTAVGDLIYGGSAGAPTKLTVGSIGHILTVSGGGVPIWSAATSSTVTASVTPGNLDSAAVIGSSSEAARADHVHSYTGVSTSASPTFTGTVTLPAGSTTVAPVKFQAGNKLTSPVAHSVDWDGTRMYVTDSTPTRHKVTYSDDADLWNLYAGVVTKPLYTDLGTGHLYVGNTGVYNFLTSVDGSGAPLQFTGVTGFTGMTMVDGATNYIYADYNEGSPLITYTSDITTINRTTKIPIIGAYRQGNYLHTWNYDEMGIGLANKISNVLSRTQKLVWESGLTLTESGTRNVDISTGVVWRSAVANTVTSYTSGTDNLFFCYKASSVWTVSSIATYNNTQYQGATDLVTLSSGRYAVNFIYRGIEDTPTDTYYVMGRGDYILVDAITAQPPVDLPEIITSHAILVGRIVVLKGVNTAYQIDNAYGNPRISITPINTAPLWVATADVGPIATTTTPTTLLGTGIGNLTLPANYLTPGKRITFKLGGTFRDNNSTPTFSIIVKFGSTTVLDVNGTLTTLTALTQWTFDAELICRTSGAPGTVKSHGRFMYGDGTAQVAVRDVSTTTTNVTTTSSQVIDIVQTWGTSHANNTITCDIAIIEGMY